MLASPLKIVASKNPNVKKMVDTRKGQLKSIRTQLKKISTDEKDRLKGLWDMHKELFASSEEELQVEVVQDTSIDDFFEK